jgi:hypothetical protein
VVIKNGSSTTSPLLLLLAEQRLGEQPGNAEVIREPFLGNPGGQAVPFFQGVFSSGGTCNIPRGVG